MSYQWFRLYSEIRTDPKILRLTPSERWAWVGMLCMASESTERGMVRIADGVPYEPAELAKALDVSEMDIQGLLTQGARMGMLAVCDEGIRILHFVDRQYENPSDRPAATRDRQRKSRRCHDTVTSESRDRSDQNRTDQIRSDADDAAGAACLAAELFGSTEHTQQRLTQLLQEHDAGALLHALQAAQQYGGKTWRYVEAILEKDQPMPQPAKKTGKVRLVENLTGRITVYDYDTDTYTAEGSNNGSQSAITP